MKRRITWLLITALLLSIRGNAPEPAVPSTPKAPDSGVLHSELSDFIRMDEQSRSVALASLYARPADRKTSADSAEALSDSGAASSDSRKGSSDSRKGSSDSRNPYTSSDIGGAVSNGEASADKIEALSSETETDRNWETETGAVAEIEPEPETAAEIEREPETAAEIEPAAEENPLHALGDNPNKQALLFGEDGQRYTSGEEADAHMEDVEVPVWVQNGDGTRTGKTMWVRVNAALAEDVREIFTEIYEDPEQFPVEYLGGFVWRDRNPASEHCSGTAIDINPDQNYQVRDGNAMTGSCWEPGQDPRSITPNGIVVRAFAEHGWSWGGDAWAGFSDQSTGYHDYMHFSYMGR